jgi:hypothetical protein
VQRQQKNGMNKARDKIKQQRKILHVKSTQQIFPLTQEN